MNAVSWLLDQMVAHGPSLLAGVSLVLVAGCLAIQGCRHPSERRRLGLLTALACGGFLLFGTVPMPRWLPTDSLLAPPPIATASATLPPPSEPIDPAVRIATLLAAIDDLVPSATTPAPELAATLPTTPPLTWERLAAMGYLGVAALLLLRAAFGALRLTWLLRSARPGPRELAQAAGLPNGARLYIARRPVRPFCAGIWRPIVVLPADLLAPARRPQALAVLRHEAAHLRARDPQAQLLLALLAVPLGLHPLFWWLCRDVRFQSELLADDAAAGVAGASTYARSLLELAEGARPEFAAIGTVPVFHRPSEFFRRIQMLLQRQGHLSPSPSRARSALHTLAACAVVAAAGSLFGVPLVAQDPASAPVELRDQNERLRAELEALRAELTTLRATLLQADSTSLLGSLTADPRLREDFIRRLNGMRFGLFDAPAGVPLDAARTYQVRPGDTVASIARKELGQDANLAEELRKYNPGVKWDALRVGQTLNLPPRAGLDTIPIPPEASGNSETSHQDPTQPDRAPAGVPVLRDVPLISRLFVDTNNDGLPDHSVQQDVAAPADRPTAGSSAEATADLATRCLDLQGEIELAEANASEIEQLAAAGRVSTVEARKAAVNLNTLKRKQAIVQRLIRGEIEATQSELQWLERKKKEADKTERLRLDMQVQRATTRLEVLRAVK